MFRLNRALCAGLFLLPPALAWAAALARRPLALALAVPCLFAAVAWFPPAKRHENLWMFLLVAVTGVPFNLSVIAFAARYPFLLSKFALLSALRGALLYLVLFAAEQLAFGYAARWLWPNQFRIRFRK